MPNEETIKFACSHCAQPIEAPPEMRGMETQCPTCGKTVKVQPIQPPLPPPPKAKTGKLLAIQGEWKMELEETLDGAAGFVLGIGVICGLIGIIAAVVDLNADSKNAGYFACVFLVGGIATIVISYCTMLLLKAAAEIIRLLKKQAGLPISGHFSFECSECKTQMSLEWRVCPKCGAKFEK
jgi:DNA-directed RNA polymerase subunit RPC12/RpoP